MNVVFDGEFLPMAALPKFLRQKYGWCPDIASIRRWRTKGLCKGTVVLQTIRRGNHLYTSEPWLNEFFQKQEEFNQQKEARAIHLQNNLRITWQRKQSRRANRDHQESLARLAVVYGRAL